MKNPEAIQSIKKGTVMSNHDIVITFKCGLQGGMRRSLKTNSLVLISTKEQMEILNVHKTGNKNRWDFIGMGRNGDQKLDYLQNKTLLESNENGVHIYLIIKENNEYIFIDRVLLIDNPVLKSQKDEDGRVRRVWVFPLIEVGKVFDIYNFLFTNSRDLLETRDNILSFPQYRLTFHSIDPLIELMTKKGIDTLIAPGGWFLTKTRYFNNPNAKTKLKKGNIDELINKDSAFSNKAVFEGQNKFINPFYLTSGVRRNNEVIDTAGENKEMNFTVNYLKYQYPNSQVIEINFRESKQFDDERSIPFVSLIIGPNGTGKSTVLGTIQKIFLDAFNYATSKNTHHVSAEIFFHIEYQIGEDTYEIIQEKNVYSRKYYKNTKKIPFKLISLPNKLIVSAFSINDKFTFNNKTENANERYNYLGIKSSNNLARVGETTKNLVLNIINSSQKAYFNKNLKFIFEFINVEPIFRIKFSAKSGKLLEEINENNIIYLQNKLRMQPKNIIKNVNFVEYREIRDFIEQLLDGNPKYNFFKIDNEGIIIDFGLKAEEYYVEYYEQLYLIWHLFEIGVFKEPIVYLKKNKFYKLKNASSGESQYLTNLINILSKVEDNSLIIIDEPETSLHPNWQYKYIEGIREIFKNYSSCHFIMATHSHFLISDLKPEFSSIVSINKDIHKGIITRLHDEETFGWNPDDILYNIFNMKTSRNFFLEHDLVNLLSFISSGDKEKFEEIKRIINKIEKLPLKNHDPLNQIIEQAKGYINNA